MARHTHGRQGLALLTLIHRAPMLLPPSLQGVTQADVLRSQQPPRLSDHDGRSSMCMAEPSGVECIRLLAIGSISDEDTIIR
jgi:hypothetical protein